MSSLRKCMGATGWILAAAALSSPIRTEASPIRIDCSERGASFRLLTANERAFSISVDGYYQIEWYQVSGDTSVKINIGDGYQSVASDGSYNTTEGLDRFKIRITGEDAAIAVSCDVGAGDQTEFGVSATAGANSQTFATNIGVGTNSQNRFGFSGNIVSENQLFMSTSNPGSGRYLPADWSAWMTLEGRGYNGGITGVTYDFVGGVDRLVAPDSLIGVLGGYGRTFITDTGTAEEANSPMVGAYFGRLFADSLILDGFISAANPTYAISGAVFQSTRVSAGLTLTGQYYHQGLTIEPFIKASGYQEQQPSYTTGGGAVIGANETRALAASLGVRVKLAKEGDTKKLVPYVSAAADIKRMNTTLGGLDVVAAPRVAVGLKGELGKGLVSLDLDIGKTRSDTIDRGVKLGYELNFWRPVCQPGDHPRLRHFLERNFVSQAGVFFQAPRSIAATPVRAISVRPRGRIRSMNASIFSGVPVISKTKLSNVESTTDARKISASRMASTRFSPVPDTFSIVSSRSTLGPSTVRS